MQRLRGCLAMLAREQIRVIASAETAEMERRLHRGAGQNAASLSTAETVATTPGARATS